MDSDRSLHQKPTKNKVHSTPKRNRWTQGSKLPPPNRTLELRDDLDSFKQPKIKQWKKIKEQHSYPCYSEFEETRSLTIITFYYKDLKYHKIVHLTQSEICFEENFRPLLGNQTSFSVYIRSVLNEIKMRFFFSTKSIINLVILQ